MSEMMNVMLAAFSIAFYLMSVIFNTAVLFTYFQRNRLAMSEVHARKHFFKALGNGFLGVFVLPAVVVYCEFPKFGIKFWPGEISHVENPWHTMLQGALANQAEIDKMKTTVDGKCIDIWEV